MKCTNGVCSITVGCGYTCNTSDKTELLLSQTLSCFSKCDSRKYLTSIFWVHVRRVEAKIDEKGDGHSILEPLHHIGLAVQGVGHVASQDDVLSCTGRHKLGLLSHSVGTWENSMHRSAQSTLTVHFKPWNLSYKYIYLMLNKTHSHIKPSTILLCIIFL